jgi:hypothetical protein
MGPLTKRIERGPNVPAEVKPEEQKRRSEEEELNKLWDDLAEKNGGEGAFGKGSKGAKIEGGNSS